MSSSVYVVGIDTSESSRRVIEYAMQRAKADGARLQLIHVIDWSPFEFHTLEENESQSIKRREQIEQDRQMVFGPIVENMQEAGIEANVEVIYGHPAQVLANTAESLDADGIILGRSSHKRLFGLGSTPARVAAVSKCPVTTVP